MKTFHKLPLLLALGLTLNLRAATNDIAEFSGTVVDAQGNPVANAEVDCYQYATSMSLGPVDMEEKQHATTDARGAFAFPTFEGMGYVVVTKAGTAPTWRTWYVAPQEPQKIVLSTPSVLAGVVADDAGRPVADAEVWVASASNKAVSDIGQPNYMFGNVTRGLFSTRTAADGTFRIENFPADAQAELSVKTPGKALRQSSSPYRYDKLPFHAGQQDITLILDPAGSISGKVMERANGQPLAGAMIGLRPSGQGYSPLDEGTIVSAADGSFQILDVPAGSYQIMAEFTNQPIPDWVVNPVPITVTIGANTSGVQMQAYKGGVLEVTVRDKSTHEAITGAGVQIYSQDNSSRGGTTGADGVAYVRSSLGDFTLGVNKPGWSQAQEQVTVSDGQTTQVSVDLPEPLKISGIVRDASGAPVAGANVSVLPNYGNLSTGATTDTNGHYNLSWEEPSWAGQQQQQDFYLFVKDAGQNLAAIQGISDGTTNLDVNLKPAMSLSGSVHDTSGNAVTNAMVYVMLYEENSGFPISRRPIPLDAQGRIHVEDLPLGERYGLSISGNGYGSARQEMDAADPKADHYDFLPMVVKIADRKLAGRVLGANGSPVAGAQVFMYGEGQPNSSIISDADGRFAFDAVCEGPITINASLNNANGRTQTTGGNTNIVIRMSENRPYIGGASQTLTGTVYDASGDPSSSARVVVTPSMGRIDIAKTDDKGAYSVTWQAQPGMQGAKYFAIARDVNRNLAAIEPIKTSTKSTDLRLGPALTISGTVENADGAPLARANINLNMMAGNMGGLVEYGRIKMNSDGTFTIPALPMGQRYIVYATAEGHGSAQKSIGITQSGTNAIQLAPFKLKTANLELAGRILGTDGKPLAGATLFINGRDQPNGQVTSDENGHFEFKVCDGPVTIYAWSQSGNGRNDSANVDARGGDTNVVVKMGGQRQRRAATVVRQDPLIPQAWTLGAFVAWPAAHKTGMIVLLSLQAAILLGTCAGIFLFTRKQG